MRKEHKSPNVGLNKKGRDYFKRKTGANLKPPAPNPKTKKDKGRKKSFCARMSGVKGPMKKDGKPTRKALALRKWKC